MNVTPRRHWKNKVIVTRQLLRLVPSLEECPDDDDLTPNPRDCILMDACDNGKRSPWKRIHLNHFPGCPNGKVYAHRYFYALIRGPIPMGHDLNHVCRNKHCVNPYHLEVIGKSEHGKISQKQQHEPVDFWQPDTAIEYPEEIEDFF